MPHVKWDRWFELHTFEIRDGHWFRRGAREWRDQNVDEYISLLSSLTCPVYMQQHWPEIPNSVEFPLDRVLSSFRRIFKGTPSYLLALAMLEGATTIGIWGVDLSANEEYAAQKPSTYYLLGYAEGKGIELVIPEESDLLKIRNLYGFEDVKEDLFTRKIQAHIQNFKEELDRTAQKRIEVNRKESEIAGMIQGLYDVIKIWQS